LKIYRESKANLERKRCADGHENYGFNVKALLLPKML